MQIFNQNDAELEVRVMLPDAERDDLASLQRFPIRTPSGEFVPLANVAELYNRRGIDVIRHNNSEMAVRVFATVDPEVTNAFQDRLRTSRASYLPDILATHHLTFGLSGKTEDDRVIVETMTLGGVLTLLMIYLILACSFSSYVWPLAIMTAIPFGLTGAILGHWIWGEDIGAMSLLAFFCLSGVVVNDSIVLVSFLRRELETGSPLRAALERCGVGALPRGVPDVGDDEHRSAADADRPRFARLLHGADRGHDRLRPDVSTLLVLVVVPALITLLEGVKTRVQRATSTQKPPVALEGSPS